MKFSNKSGLLLLALLLFTACRTNKRLPSSTKGLAEIISQSTAFNDGFSGFALYDPVTNKSIWERQANQHFTPASNTKILTLYAALKILDGPLPAMRYRQTDSIIQFQGTGCPSFLNSALTQENLPVFNFLKDANETLVFCDCNFQDARFGSGWSWDDYHYSFQTEKSPFPIYGNIVQFKKSMQQKELTVFPNFFRPKILKGSKQGRPAIYRQLDENIFDYSGTDQSFDIIKRPFRPTAQTVVELLSDTLMKPVQLCNAQCQPENFKEIITDIEIDQLFQRLLHDSDNFVAEQLLLMCANELSDTLQVKKAINWSLKNLLSDLSALPLWVDGSGLSRYNKVTPRAMVEVLNKIYTKIPEERLFNIFPAGGESGTIKNGYNGTGAPYVYAKTGSLRHVRCLSGYIKTKSGRILTFSFMHNNFTCPSKELKMEMEKALMYVHLNY